MVGWSFEYYVFISDVFGIFKIIFYMRNILYLVLVLFTISVIGNIFFVHELVERRLAYSGQPLTVKGPGQHTADTSSILGQPCSYKGGGTEAELAAMAHGLQCYFYGDVQATGSRVGVWITPDTDQIRFPGVDFKRAITWKTYTNTKLGLAFEYPAHYVVKVDNFNDMLNSVNVTNAEGEKVFGFTVVPQAATDSTQADASEYAAFSSVMNKQGFQNQQGLDGVAYTFQPKTNLEQPLVLYDLRYGKSGRVRVEYKKGYGTDMEYMNDVMLQSLRAIQ